MCYITALESVITLYEPRVRERRREGERERARDMKFAMCKFAGHGMRATEGLAA